LRKVSEELVESALVAHVGLLEVVVGDGHVLAVAGHIEVLARPLGDLAVAQVALEDARRGQGIVGLGVLEGALEPRADAGDVGEIHLPLGSQLIQDHLHPGRPERG
jgi:hypothetical protein